MLIIKNTQFTSDISLADIMNVMTKVMIPDYVREAFTLKYKPYLDIAERGTKLPSKKQIRMMAALGRFLDGEY